MPCSGRLKFVLLLAMALVASSRPRFAHAQPSESADAALKDLQQQESYLTERASGGTAEERNRREKLREDAANRLVNRSSPEADQILLRVLSDPSNAAGQLVIARALITDPTPEPAFIDPLAALLSRDRPLADAAAQALAAYRGEPQALERLMTFSHNLNQSIASRVAAIRGLGRITDKRSASTLIDLLNSDSNTRIRDAAADALAQMTGQSRIGADIQRWNQWWEANRSQPDAEWERVLLSRNVRELADAERRLALLRESMSRTLAEDYRRTPDAEKPKALTAYLQDPSEDVRLIAAAMAYDEIGGGRLRPVPAEVSESLRRLVGDSSPDVREQVARTLGATSDPEAVAALLAQLAQENDPDVREQIIQALGQSGSTQPIEVLVAALDDPSFALARSAASALRELAGVLRSPANAAQIDRVSRSLLSRLRTTDRNAAAAELREAIADAMSRIAHPSFLQSFYELAHPRESIQTRTAAYRGMGLIANPDSATEVAKGLVDPERVVRREAIRAMALVGTVQNAAGVHARLQNERDEELRGEIWSAFLRLLEKGTARDLTRWPQQFNNAPERRVAVLRLLEKKLVADKSEEELARVRATLGETLVSLRTAESGAEAVTMLRGALDYYTSKSYQDAVIRPVKLLLMEALLLSKAYADAETFATKMITADGTIAPDMWIKFRDEANRLARAKEGQTALDVLGHARKVPFPDLYANNIRMLEELIRQGIDKGGFYVRQLPLICPDEVPFFAMA